ncbi:MAG: DoxX family protein [Pikeienuella sp.]
MPRLKTCLWATAIGYTAIIMIGGGGAKLIGYQMAHISFAVLGLPAWFGYFIGVAEVLGGIALFISPLRRYAAAGLFAIMAGAIYFHVFYTPLTFGIPAALTFLACAYLVLWPAKDVIGTAQASPAA